LKEIEEFAWTGCTSLFDNHVADSVPEALTYMGNKFAFFIPDNDFVSDLDGILTYLAMKINLGHQCTYCHKTFKSGDSTRKHMVDKGHCKLAFGVGHEDEVGIMSIECYKSDTRGVRQAVAVLHKCHTGRSEPRGQIGELHESLTIARIHLRKSTYFISDV
jgi:5-methylcytosine-specific restriction endonuclease McrA